MSYPLGVRDGERDDVGTGRIVANQYGAGNDQTIKYRVQFGTVVVRGRAERLTSIGTPVPEPVEGHDPPRGQKRCEIGSSVDHVPPL